MSENDKHKGRLRGVPDLPSPSLMTNEQREAYLKLMEDAKPKLGKLPGKIVCFGTGGGLKEGEFEKMWNELKDE